MSASKSKPAPIEDDVFFHRGQVTVGAVLMCMGRLDPRSKWTVTGIKSYTRVSRGVYRGKSVKRVEHLGDEVSMRRAGTNERRQATFAYLSYSAIWRLHNEGRNHSHG
jgi:hypothetical protein